LPDISANPPDLPPPDTKRWVARRKAAIVNAVRSGEMNIEDACRYYKLSTEEFAAWERAIEAHGVAGLRVTRLQVYRDAPPTRLAKSRETARSSEALSPTPGAPTPAAHILMARRNRPD
jgi:Protein of unknown function (DUF1153)